MADDLRPDGGHECRECNMTFPSADKLANHKKKFCVNTVYADPLALAAQLKGGSNASKPRISYEEVTEYLQGGGSSLPIGSLPLSELKKQVDNHEEDLERFEKDYVKRRQAEQVLELRKLKQDQAKLRADQQKEEALLLAKMRALEKAREDEVRARVDREEARRELESMDKSNWMTVEREKRKELEKLAKDREDLERKEAEILSHIESLESKMSEHELARKQKKEALDTLLNANGPKREFDTEAKLKLAQERGQAAAQAKTQTELLKAEKSKIDARLSELGRPSAQNEVDIAAVTREAKAHAGEGKNRLKKLEKMHEQFLLSEAKTLDEMGDFEEAVRPEGYQPPVRPQSSAGGQIGAHYLGGVSGKGNSAKYDAALEELNEVGLQSKAAMQDVITDGMTSLLEKKESLRNQLILERRELEKERSKLDDAHPQAAASSSSPVSVATVPLAVVDSGLLAEIAALKAEYVRSGGNQPSLLAAIQMLEAEAAAIAVPPPTLQAYGAPQGAVAPPPPPFYPPGYPPGMSMAGPVFAGNPYTPLPPTYPPYPPAYPPPMYGGMMAPPLPYAGGYPPPFHPLAAQHELESNRLASELEEFMARQEEERMAEWSRGFEGTLANLTRKLDNLHAGGSSNKASAFLSEKIPNLPDDDEIRGLKTEYAKELFRMQFEQEKLRQQTELEKLKRANERADLEQEQHKMWILEQKQKFKQAGGGAGDSEGQSHDRPITPIEAAKKKIRYNAAEGFAVFWDFVRNLPGDVHQCYISYAFLQGSTDRTPAKGVPLTDTVADGTLTLCNFRKKKLFKNVPVLSDLKLLFDVMVVYEEDAPAPGQLSMTPRMKSIAWGVFDVFYLDKLRAGSYCVPLFKPPIVRSVTLDTIDSKCTVTPIQLYIRVCPGAKAEAQALLDVDPLVTQDYQDALTYRPTTTRGGERDGGRPEGGGGARGRKRRDPESESHVIVLPDVVVPSTVNEVLVEVWGITNMKVEAPVHVIVSVLLGLQPAADVHGNPLVFTCRGDFMSDNNGTIVIRDSEKFSLATVRKFQPQDAPILVFEVVDVASSTTIAWSYMYLFASNVQTDMPDINTGKQPLEIFRGPVTLPMSADAYSRTIAQGTMLTVNCRNPDDASHTQLIVDLNGEDVIGVPRAAWMAVENSQSAPRNYITGDGIDVYIDGARFLPDNVTITRVFGKVFGKDWTPIDVGTIETGVHVLSDAYNPVYDYQHQIRADISDSTATLLLKIVTISTESDSPLTVGLAAFPLFIDAVSGEQPTDFPSLTPVKVNVGAFQLRLRRESPSTSSPCTGTMLNKARSIPCCTILIRVAVTPRDASGRLMTKDDVPPQRWEATGVLVPVPAYTEAVYDSRLCLPAGPELFMYTNRLARPRLSIRDAAVRAGMPAALPDEDIVTWIYTRLPRPSGKDTFIDFNYSTKYNAVSGFKIAVDCGANLKNGAFTNVMFSASPPAAYYRDNPDLSGVYFTMSRNWEGDQVNPQWTDGYKSFPNIELDPNLVVVFEVLEMDVGKKSFGEVRIQGWTCVSIFERDYVRSGEYMLPLYQGEPPVGLLKTLTTSDAKEILQQSLAKGVLRIVKGAWIGVRVCDAQRVMEAELRTPIGRFNKEWLPVGSESKYNGFKEGKKVAKLLPASETIAEFEARAAIAFSQSMKIPIN